MDTVFFLASKLLGIALKLEVWLLAMAFMIVWAGLRQRLRVVQIFSPALFLAILGIGFLPVGDILLRPLETVFPVNIDLGTVDGVILLGGAEDLPASRQAEQPQLGESGDRYIAALALAHRHPKARVLFAGGSGRLQDVAGNNLSEATIAEQIFREQGIAAERVFFESRSRNTAENARLSHALAAPGADERWVLVTSAFHMPRAVNSFEAAGWPNIIPFPVDFRTRAWPDGLEWDFQRNLGLTNTALREWVGRAVYAMTGR